MSHPHQAWSELAAGYSLGSLDADERATFEMHLAGCKDCQAEVDSYRDVVGSIGLGAPVVPPPPHLRARILAETKSVRALNPPTQFQRLLPWLVAAAAMTVAIASLLMYASERSRRELAESAGAAAATQLMHARKQVAQQDSMLAAILAPDAESARLVAQGRPPSVRLFLNRRRNMVVLSARDLAPAAAGRTYQLWGIADGQPVSMGTFNTSADGQATVVLPLATDARFTHSAITDEPAGGSPQPTTTPFIAGAWQ
ncbi:MAG: anti-sigma factor [Gemmatimonadota bacterium]